MNASSASTARSRIPVEAGRILRLGLLLALVTLLILPGLQPVLRAEPTCSYGGDFHIWRGVQLDHLLRQGVLYPRWAPDMAQGFGYPLFEFVTPLSTYWLVGLKGLGLSWGAALNGTLALGLLLSALCVYLLVREWWGGSAGLVAAVAYAWVPYHAYDLFNRSGLSETSAWFLPPLIMWGMARSDRRAFGLVVTALGAAALVLTHNAFALIFTPFLLAYALLLGRLQGRRALGLGALGLGLGVGLSTFFWLPALAELDYVHSQRLTDAWVFQYANNFLSLDQLLAVPRLTDPTLVNDWPPKALGLALALAASLPLLGWRRLARSDRWRVAFFAASLLLFGAMTLPFTRPLWDHVPLLPYVQFPWRFLGAAGLCAAILAGGGVAAVEARAGRPGPDQPGFWQRNRGLLLSLGLILGLFVASQGWFFPKHCPPPADLSIAGMIKWEQTSHTLGTTAGGEYLPIWVERMPGEGGEVPSLAETYSAGEPVVRLPAEELPAGARLLRAEYGPVDAEIELDTPTPFRARYLAFYYPGWEVRLNGQEVPVEPDQPYGLLAFDVPAGRHLIQVRFGSTRLRTAAVVVSGLALVCLGLAILALRRRPAPGGRVGDGRDWWIGGSRYRAYLALGLGLFVVRALIAGGHTPLRHSRLSDGQLQGVGQSYQVDFGHRWLLLGRDRLPERLPADEPLEVVLYWRPLDPQGRDYGAALILVDEMGQRWSQVGNRSPRWHRPPPPVYAWPPDSYGLTAHLVDLQPGAPPGDYRLRLVAFDKANPPERLTAYGPGGAALGPWLDLGQVRVERPRTPPDPTEVLIQFRLGAAMGPLTLVGANLDRTEARPGDPVLVTLFWAVGEGEDLPDLSARLALVDGAGGEVAAWERPPVRADWPTTSWQPGDLWRGQHLLRLPAGLKDGAYTWQVSLSQPGGVTSPLALGPLAVDGPDRLWRVPPLQRSLNADLGGRVRLLGANLEPPPGAPLAPGEALAVTLVWQGRVEIDVSYRVFAHLVGPDGELVDQSDGEPANWGRPTTGWASGEVVLDRRVLSLPADVPPGEYTLLVGMYDPDSKTRLSLPDGETAVYVTSIPVGPGETDE